eukprot:13230209-Alexandrium_andersonii.AAC.1
MPALRAGSSSAISASVATSPAKESLTFRMSGVATEAPPGGGHRVQEPSRRHRPKRPAGPGQ